MDSLNGHFEQNLTFSIKNFYNFNENFKNGIWFWGANQIVFKDTKKNVTWQWSVSNQNSQYSFDWIKWRNKWSEIGESELQ